MRRISHITADPDANGASKPGFTQGNAATQVPPTRFTTEWFNGVQESICLAVEGAGLTLDPNDNGQLLEAIDARVEDAEVRYANYSVTGGGTNTSLFTLAEDVDSGGFGLAANVVTFPSVGAYQVSVCCYLTTTSTTNPEAPAVRINIAGSGVMTVTGRRFSADASHLVPCVATITVVVANTGTDTLTLTYSGNGTGAIATSSKMYIHKLR